MTLLENGNVRIGNLWAGSEYLLVYDGGFNSIHFGSGWATFNYESTFWVDGLTIRPKKRLISELMSFKGGSSRLLGVSGNFHDLDENPSNIAPWIGAYELSLNDGRIYSAITASMYPENNIINFGTKGETCYYYFLGEKSEVNNKEDFSWASAISRIVDGGIEPVYENHWTRKDGTPVQCSTYGVFFDNSYLISSENEEFVNDPMYSYLIKDDEAAAFAAVKEKFSLTLAEFYSGRGLSQADVDEIAEDDVLDEYRFFGLFLTGDGYTMLPEYIDFIFEEVPVKFWQNYVNCEEH